MDDLNTRIEGMQSNQHPSGRPQFIGLSMPVHADTVSSSRPVAGLQLFSMSRGRRRGGMVGPDGHSRAGKSAAILVLAGVLALLLFGDGAVVQAQTAQRLTA